MNDQISIFTDNPEYEAFVNKFKPKKTTDDCYTPPKVYEAVKDWVCEECGVNPDNIVRPFYPGGDYENFSYPKGCVVLDNPPFSILAKICEFYLDCEISFFLFAPSLTALSGKDVCMRMNHIICDACITYENGAVVCTAFVTNLGDRETVAQTAPKLGAAINTAVRKIKKEQVRQLPKYEYPDHVVTAALINRYSKYGVDFKIKRSDCVRISALDAQKDKGKEIFGGGLLLSHRAEAEKKAAEKKIAEKKAAEKAEIHVWKLSDREWEIVESLG